MRICFVQNKTNKFRNAQNRQQANLYCITPHIFAFRLRMLTKHSKKTAFYTTKLNVLPSNKQKRCGCTFVQWVSGQTACTSISDNRRVKPSATRGWRPAWGADGTKAERRSWLSSSIHIKLKHTVSQVQFCWGLLMRFIISGLVL